MSPDDDDLVRDALSRAPFADPGPCPDENALLAWAEGHLDRAAADAVERHLAACDACRDVLGDLRAALAEAGEDAARGPAAAGPGTGTAMASEPEAAREAGRAGRGGAAGAEGAPSPRRAGRVLFGLRPRWAAVAAGVLLLVGAGVLLALRGGPGGPGVGSGDGTETLSAAVRSVAQAAGGRFEAMGPLAVAELERGRPVDAPRGGLVLLRPRGVVFGPQPFFAWTAVPGVTSYALTVRDATGRVLWRADAETRLTIPSDPAAVGGAPGEARIVEVAADGAFGRTVARSTFTFAGAEDRAARARAREAAARLAPGTRAVALAHLAAQAGWWEQALVWAEEAPGRREPGTPAHTISQFVRRSLGLPLEGEVEHGEK